MGYSRLSLSLLMGTLLFTWSCYSRLNAKLKEKSNSKSNLNSSNQNTDFNDIFPLDNSSKNDTSSYVFLQKFPLQGTFGMLFHTEVLVCPQNNFDRVDQQFLNDYIESLTDFIQIDNTWWSERSIQCVELGYAGSSCVDRCCSVPHVYNEMEYALNDHHAVIENIVGRDKTLFLYGISSNMDGDSAYSAACNQKCWSDWAGTDYNAISNNCNTFTSTVLRCVFGLSEKKPNLGVSDMVQVTCKSNECNIHNTTTSIV